MDSFKLVILAFCYLLTLESCSESPNSNSKSGEQTNLVLNLVDKGELIHSQDTGIPFFEQESKERILREIDVRLIGKIDISDTYYLFLNVYKGQPCVVNMSITVVECFTDSGEIFQRFGMGRGEGPGELYAIRHFAINDSGYALLADGGAKQKIMNNTNEEIMFNITLPFEPTPEVIGSSGNDKFAYAKGLYLNEPSIQYFEKQIDGTWAKIIGSNLYDQNKPLGVSRETYDPMKGPPKDLVAVPHVFMGHMDGHSDDDFIIATTQSGLLLRMDNKKATWVRNQISNPMSGSIEMATSIPNLPEELRPAYSPPFYYLPRVIDRASYTYAVKVQDGHIINIDFIADERRVLFDFYAEVDGSYLHSYEFVAGTSLTYLGIQLSGNRLYILNGAGMIVIFELEFL